MPRSTKRANEQDLNTLHRLATKALIADIRRMRRAKEPIPSGTIANAIKLLSITGSTTPDRSPRRKDRLADLLVEHEAAEAAETQRPLKGRGSQGPNEIPDFELPKE
jgi:hypothetical protein